MEKRRKIKICKNKIKIEFFNFVFNKFSIITKYLLLTQYIRHTQRNTKGIIYATIINGIGSINNTSDQITRKQTVDACHIDTYHILHLWRINFCNLYYY